MDRMNILDHDVMNIILTYLGKDSFHLFFVNKKWKKFISDLYDNIMIHHMIMNHQGNMYNDSMFKLLNSRELNPYHTYFNLSPTFEQYSLTELEAYLRSYKIRPIFKQFNSIELKTYLIFYKISSILSDGLTINNQEILYTYIINNHNSEESYRKNILKIIETPNFAEHMKQFGMDKVFILLKFIFRPFFDSLRDEKLIIIDGLFKIIKIGKLMKELVEKVFHPTRLLNISNKYNIDFIDLINLY